jgi:hypothetical protein
MTPNPVLPIRQRATHRFQKSLGAELTRLYSAVLAEPPPESFLRLLAQADRLALPKAPNPPPSTTPRSKLTLFG